jgi:UDP-N-acetylglucosamine--N-acetylmuramyl-(pentapeptide) pyrophosphoryl-undecaprenol N-acetylglucosamine transferase
MTERRLSKVLLAAGGTGGHILPAIALGRALEERGLAKVSYLCGQRPVELDLYSRENIEPIVVAVRQLGASVLERLRGGWAAIAVTWRCRRLIHEERFDAVVGMGGYVSGPAVLAGIVTRRATVIHEANSVPGKTNRWLAPWVKMVAVNFSRTASQLRSRQCEIVGMPIRSRILHGFREKGIELFGLDARKRTLLVVGGSQGARNLNYALAGALPLLDRPEFSDVQLLWSTGASHYDNLVGLVSRLGLQHLRVKLVPFIAEMEHALACADAAISRAGASAIAELLATGVFALYVPLPNAIYDHQRKNALELVSAGLGMMLLEHEMTPQTTMSAIAELLALAPAKREAVAAAGEIHRHAAEKLAMLVSEAANSR